MFHLDEIDEMAEREGMAIRYSGRSVSNPHRKHRAEKQPATIFVDGKVLHRLLCPQEAQALESQNIPIFRR